MDIEEKEHDYATAGFNQTALDTYYKIKDAYEIVVTGGEYKSQVNVLRLQKLLCECSTKILGSWIEPIDEMAELLNDGYYAYKVGEVTFDEFAEDLDNIYLDIINPEIGMMEEIYEENKKS